MAKKASRTHIGQEVVDGSPAEAKLPKVKPIIKDRYQRSAEVEMTYLNDDGGVTLLDPSTLEFVDVSAEDCAEWGMDSPEHGYGFGISVDINVAKKLLGWEDQVTNAAIKRAGCDLTIKVPNSNPEKDADMTLYVNMKRNPHNRPLRKTLADDYADQMLRNEWKYNGEAIIFGTNQMLNGGQHRLVGLVLAEYKRQRDPKHYGEEPIVRKFYIVSGIDPTTQDTTDIGQTRNYGDVLFQRAEFDPAQYNERDAKKLSTDLGGGIRLVWLRSAGLQIADAKKLHNPVMLRMLDMHPRLKDATECIYKIDNDSIDPNKDAKERQKSRINKYVSKQQAVGLMYLMATSFTEDANDINYDNWEVAEEFWTNFADLDVTGWFSRLREALQMHKSGAEPLKRDQVNALTIKVYRSWVDEKKPGKVGLNAQEKENPGSIKIGGLDVDPEE